MAGAPHDEATVELPILLVPHPPVFWLAGWLLEELFQLIPPEVLVLLLLSPPQFIGPVGAAVANELLQPENVYSETILSFYIFD